MNCPNTSDDIHAPRGSRDFSVSVEDHPQGVILHVDGEIDSLTVSQFAATLRTDTSGRPLVVDLRGVGFLGSVGLAALVLAQERTASEGPEVRLVVGDNRVVLRPMTVTGLLTHFAAFTDIDQAFLVGHDAPAVALVEPTPSRIPHGNRPNVGNESAN